MYHDLLRHMWLRSFTLGWAPEYCGLVYVLYISPTILKIKNKLGNEGDVLYTSSLYSHEIIRGHL